MINRIHMSGNVTREIELGNTNSGTSVANFTLAQSTGWKDKETNEWIEGETIFLDCTTYGRLAEQAAQILTKGDRVVIEGHLRAESWETEDGKTRRKNICIVDSFVSMTAKDAEVLASEEN